jgi:hypothetical protein
MKRATKLVPDWDFILKIDADSVLPRDFPEDYSGVREESETWGVKRHAARRDGLERKGFRWRQGLSQGMLE